MAGTITLGGQTLASHDTASNTVTVENVDKLGIGVSPTSALTVKGPMEWKPTVGDAIHLGAINGYANMELSGSVGGIIDFNKGDGTDRQGAIGYNNDINQMDFHVNNALRMTIFNDGRVNFNTGTSIDNNPIWNLVDIQRKHLGSGNSTTIAGNSDWTNVGASVSHTPKKAGNILVIEHGVQTWNGATSLGSGDIMIQFVMDYDQHSEVSWRNERAQGNFDQSKYRTHLYLRSQFLYTTKSTSPITIQFQAKASGSLPAGYNFYHTGDSSNQYIIMEYQQ